MSGQYVLRDGMPVPEPDIFVWGRWFETADRVVAKTLVGDVRVSTVFLALDHCYDGGPPLLWETMIFGGPLDGETWRYSTRAQAEAGHLDAVEKAKALP